MTDRIVIWKSYGDVVVYAADTAPQLRGIINQICECLDGWGYEDTVDLALTVIATVPEDDTLPALAVYINQLIRTLRDLIEAVTEGERHEQFEYVQLTRVQSVVR